MQKKAFDILPTGLLDEYRKQVPAGRLAGYERLEESELSAEAFSFYTSVSAVFSSKIERGEIELDSYVKYKRFGVEFRPDYTRKTDDLYNAYQFAKSARCNREHIAEAHRMFTAHLLPKSRQGKLRTGNMYVTIPEGKKEYVMGLSLQETFFYAALLHLVFVKTHPFDDGNGRTSRLLEKWFLAEKLGEKAWLIQSEKYYYLRHDDYHKNIRLLGLEYENLDYSKALPFLLMLPQSLTLSET